jgi:hypothetical protein
MLLREAVWHDAVVLTHRRGGAPEAEALGLTGEKWHCQGAIPADGGSPAIELIFVFPQRLLDYCGRGLPGEGVVDGIKGSGVVMAVMQSLHPSSSGFAGLGLRLWVRIHVILAGVKQEKKKQERAGGKKTPWSRYEAAVLKRVDYTLNKHTNGSMRVAGLMEALHVPAERWQSSLSDDVFGRVHRVTTLAARERAAAPRRADLRPNPGQHDNTSKYRPDQPTRDQPARATKAARRE